MLSAQQSAPVYKDASRPVAERVADLLGRMTLEEKVAQLATRWTTLKPLQDAEGTFVPAGAPALLGQGLGQLARPSEIGGTAAGPHVRSARKHAEFTNAVQKWVLENTRLGIPVMFHEEALHGFVAPQATHFPVPLGLGATWNPSLVERAMAVAAKEARARGCQIVLSPVIDLAREPRWGRIEETYGEDPFLVSEFGIAAVRGYQGRSLPLGPGKVFATLKHFAAHGSHEGGINTAPTLVGERQLRAEFLWPFERAIKEAGAYAIMPSYNEIDGVPSHVNRWLLNDVLKGEWGFRGVIVSDYNAISQLASRHKVAVDRPQAAIQALEAGNDFETPDPETYWIAGRRGEERHRQGGDHRRVRRARAREQVPGRALREPVRERRRSGSGRQDARASRARARRRPPGDRPAAEQGQRPAARSHEDQDARRDRPERQGRPRRRLLERAAAAQRRRAGRHHGEGWRRA